MPEMSPVPDATWTIPSGVNISEWQWSRNSAITSFLELLRSQKRFTIGEIKRLQHKALLAQLHVSLGSAPCSKTEARPLAYEVEQMSDPLMFASGETPLADPVLKPAVLERTHLEHCAACAPHGSVRPQCYFFAMLRCVSHGWLPPVIWDEVHQRSNEQKDPNYPPFRTFLNSNMKEFAKMSQLGMVLPLSAEQLTLPRGPTIPMGCVIKNSDKHRAFAVSGVTIVDQESLSAANVSLEAHGLPIIKTRVTMDATRSGFNEKAYSPPFRYLSLSVPLAHIQRNDFLAKGDLSRYFWSFRFADSCRLWFIVWIAGLFYSLLNIFFGLTSAPYFTSAYGAEMLRVLRARGIVAYNMIDDWLVFAPSEALAKHKISVVRELTESWGFGWATDKEGVGQQLVFLGVLIDTVHMTLRFDKLAAKSFATQLRLYCSWIEEGRPLSSSLVSHVAGKLNWFAEVVQSGRLHIRSWWTYHRYGARTHASALSRIILDSQWWLRLLDCWAEDSHSSIDYEILSASELEADLWSIYVGQSDSSGLDGFGYFHGYLSSTHPMRWLSAQWPGGVLPPSSLYGELYSLFYFLSSTTLSSLLFFLDGAHATTHMCGAYQRLHF